MFSGIIEIQGTVKKIVRQGQGARMDIESRLPVAELALGDSIAVDGACLTVTQVTDTMFSVDISPETLQRTTLGTKRERDTVNLERALRLSSRLDGHLVTGHIDSTATIKARASAGNAIKIDFTAPPAVLRYIVEKGSVAIDGISLTVNQCTATGFTVMIIPYTAAHTTLTRKKPGDRVNIENDIIGKYVEKFITSDTKTNQPFNHELLDKYKFTQ
jgi:riboflavin synthase